MFLSTIQFSGQNICHNRLEKKNFDDFLQIFCSVGTVHLEGKALYYKLLSKKNAMHQLSDSSVYNMTNVFRVSHVLLTYFTSLVKSQQNMRNEENIGHIERDKHVITTIIFIIFRDFMIYMKYLIVAVSRICTTGYSMVTNQSYIS